MTRSTPPARRSRKPSCRAAEWAAWSIRSWSNRFRLKKAADFSQLCRICRAAWVTERVRRGDHEHPKAIAAWIEATQDMGQGGAETHPKTRTHRIIVRATAVQTVSA